MKNQDKADDVLSKYHNNIVEKELSIKATQETAYKLKKEVLEMKSYYNGMMLMYNISFDI